MPLQPPRGRITGLQPVILPLTGPAVPSPQQAVLPLKRQGASRHCLGLCLGEKAGYSQALALLSLTALGVARVSRLVL